MEGISDSDKRIIDLYNEHGSVNRIIDCTGYSHGKIKKCLSTHGYVLNEIHIEILELYKKKLPAEKIAEILGISISTVEGYLPRVRPEYGKHYSKNAKEIYNWRQRKRKEEVENEKKS